MQLPRAGDTDAPAKQSRRLLGAHELSRHVKATTASFLHYHCSRLVEQVEMNSGVGKAAMKTLRCLRRPPAVIPLHSRVASMLSLPILLARKARSMVSVSGEGSVFTTSIPFFDLSSKMSSEMPPINQPCARGMLASNMNYSIHTQDPSSYDGVRNQINQSKGCHAARSATRVSRPKARY